MGARFDLAAISAAFAEAAVDPSRWTEAMDVAARATGSFGAALIPRTGRGPGFPFSPSLHRITEIYVRDGWHLHDERDRGQTVLAQRGVAVDLDFTDQDQMRRSPYYQEFLAPHGLRWFAGVKAAVEDEAWCLSIQRGASDAPFSPREARELAGLSRSLSSSAAIARALAFARAEGALAAFEASGVAVLALDREGRVARLNAAAERLAGDGLQIRQGRAASEDPAATAALDRMLNGLLWRAEPMFLSAPVSLPRQGKRPLLAYCGRLQGRALEAFSPAVALLVLVDLESRPRRSEKALRAAFGLTPAEARLTARLASGEKLEDAARTLGITYETGRNHLKAVFGKAGVNRQSELIALLSNLVWPFV